MIVQRLHGEALAVLHDQHLNLAGQMALAWGNDEIAAPHACVIYMARNHDAGWPAYDREPLLGPDRLPLDMPDMPAVVLTGIHNRSILRNYLNHPYTGILGCCHTLGFYTGRAGVSDFLVHHMDNDVSHHPELAPYLAEYERRKDEWTKELRDRGELVDQLEPEALALNYTALQVFDTLSLYFCSFDPQAAPSQAFPNVRTNDGSTVTVEVVPEDPDALLFTFDPWPFAEGTNSAVLDRKRLRPLMTPDATIEDAPTEQLTLTFRPR